MSLDVGISAIEEVVNFNPLGNQIDIPSMRRQFLESGPFNHVILDDFLEADLASTIADEFPSFEDSAWRIYNNAIEVKKLQNHWDKFGPNTYKIFSYLNSRQFIQQLEALVGCDLYADFGLNGGGLHTHKCGGKLNVHLDYSIHPKLLLERRLNLILYITPGWLPEWGGDLGLWESASNVEQPSKMLKSISPLFNRAVLFDTTQNSWHGLPEAIKCPENVTRNSLAIYYLCKPRSDAVQRGKALFAPYDNQIGDPEIMELIRKRSSVDSASKVYGDK